MMLSQCVIAEIPQDKPGRFKHAAFVAGADRHCCFYTDFGDYLTLVAREPYNDGETEWLIPELHDSGSPGTKAGKWIKVMTFNAGHDPHISPPHAAGSVASKPWRS